MRIYVILNRCKENVFFSPNLTFFFSLVPSVFVPTRGALIRVYRYNTTTTCDYFSVVKVTRFITLRATIFYRYLYYNVHRVVKAYRNFPFKSHRRFRHAKQFYRHPISYLFNYCDLSRDFLWV